MTKKLIIVWLSLTFLLFSSFSMFSYAESAVVQADYFLRDIVINGENIINYQISNPVITFNGNVYFPLDDHISALLGLHYELDEGSRTISITDTEEQGWEPVSAPMDLPTGSITCVPRFDLDVVLTRLSDEADRPSRVSKYLNLRDKPVLERDSVIYVPIDAILSSDLLGWSISYDDDLGIIISTDDEIAAESYYEAAKQIADDRSVGLGTESTSRPEGMVRYIRQENPEVSLQDAMLMVRAFMEYGPQNGIEPELLMATAECESTFDASITNRSGTCIGLMQVNVSTAKTFGFSRDQLWDIDDNINVGAQVLCSYLKMFGDHVTVALTAYNCGPYNLQDNGYAEKVLAAYEQIKKYAGVEG